MRDPFAPVVVVAVDDPAVSFDSPEKRAEYLSTADASLLQPVENRVPVRFTIAPLSAEHALRLDAAPPVDRALLAFRACVTRVELPDGTALDSDAESGYVLGSMCSAEWVAKVGARVGVRRVRAIGEMAYRLSMMDDIDPLLQPPGQPPQS